ncbi:histidine phosphatase family protein [Micromonospora olivasterospora]|uniref:Prepilin-type processing-associated H-X9-DG protein n=1 Tax=Micromonospora olivasterospora TaxID=1880 RepID=A0A562HU89_MICOL|nr:histidine phosphatase family protein [Micromonospora olivasterospora]TWH62327.1 prepilin-type processing-associated H-X9-DG protein [Micromonospora olivasterospora]
MDTVAQLTIVRHGQSTANVAFADAQARGLADHGLTGRDAGIELSPLGWQQATHLGRWLADQPADQLPEVVVCSPYLRARQTWTRAVDTAAALGVPFPQARVDDRLCDRLMGDLELLTPLMIASRFPAEAARLAADGLYAYRPPGGETFDDVAARIRAVLADLNTRYPGQRVLVVAHDAVVVAVRHLLDGLPFTDLDAILAVTPVANTSLTRYVHANGRLGLVEFAVTPHLTGEDQHAHLGR